MCIEINRAKRAREDIPVWKVMIRHNETSELLTPFQGTSESEFSKPAKYFHRRIGDKHSKGGYHCFLSEELANDFYLTTIHYRPFCEHCIIKYYIPKGELYAEGKILKGYYGEGIDSVRARTLKLATTTNKL